MKWLSNRYAYPLVIFVIVISIALQLVWLSQLFRAQQVQVKRDLEDIAAKSAQMSNYLSLLPGHEQSQNFKTFFLSLEWLQFKQAYNNMRFSGIGSRFKSDDSQGDSTFVDISLRIPNATPLKTHFNHVTRYDSDVTPQQEKIIDSFDLKRMDSHCKCENAGNGNTLAQVFMLLIVMMTENCLRRCLTPK